MKKKQAITYLSGFALAMVTAFNVKTAVFASAVENARNGAAQAGGNGGVNFGDAIQTVTNILVYAVGLVAVIMIIIGAVKYATSNGDQSAITSAKNTIIYSIVGLILAIMAGALVTFVLDQFA